MCEISVLDFLWLGAEDRIEGREDDAGFDFVKEGVKPEAMENKEDLANKSSECEVGP